MFLLVRIGVDSLAVFLAVVLSGLLGSSFNTELLSFLALEVVGFMKLSELLAVARLPPLGLALDSFIDAVLILEADGAELVISLGKSLFERLSN